MTILKNKNYNAFLTEILSLFLILIVSLIPWFEFINSNYKEIDEILNDNFFLLIGLYLLAVTLIYFLTKFLIKDKTKLFYISLVGISIWIFFQFNLIKSFLNRILSERTGQSIEKIQQDTDRDNFLTAAEAKEYGLIDEVMEPEK